MEKANQQAVAILARIFAERRLKNRFYSARAFARDLSLSVGAISQILNAKRPLTQKTADRILGNLPLSPEDLAVFLGNRTSEPVAEAEKISQ